MNVRRTAACLTSAAALSVSGVAMAQPASAAPLFTGGLVNVNVQDVDVDVLNNSLNNNNIDILNDNEVNIGVAGQIIAQVCDVQVRQDPEQHLSHELGGRILGSGSGRRLGQGPSRSPSSSR
jgi:NAD-dependent DNA ligase